jgi:hypothetical protein
LSRPFPYYTCRGTGRGRTSLPGSRSWYSVPRGLATKQSKAKLTALMDACFE